MPNYNSYPGVADLTNFLNGLNLGLTLSFNLAAKLQSAIDNWENTVGWHPFLNGTTSSQKVLASANPVVLTVQNSIPFLAANNPNPSVPSVTGNNTAQVQAIIDTGTAQEMQPVLSVIDNQTIEVAALTNNHDGTTTPYTVRCLETRLFDPPAPPRSRGGFWVGGQGGGCTMDLDGGLTSFTSLVVETVPFVLNTQFWLKESNAPSKREPWTYIELAVPLYAALQSVAITGQWGYCQWLPGDVWHNILQEAALESVPELEAEITQGRASIKTETFAAQFTGAGYSPLSPQKTRWEDQSYAVRTKYTRITM